ncbi:hypothetical protein F6X38_21600 [Aureimonas leprariae]|uniref:Uncharacterized protein n=2 Tax=Plantimonas leprariae TaxID=2615207 RepID=A0A7V7PKT2_9HYPH|nr:hypothetical protein F6X38_21600 [Aureimonas leprariae]
MFSVAYVLLPMSDTPPAAAIRASLSPFERGGRDELPESLLAFEDKTETLRVLHEAALTFAVTGRGGLRIEGGGDAAPWSLNTGAVRGEMDRRGTDHWQVRFADTMALDAFVPRYAASGLERHPVTGGWGRWLNPLGRWDWWDLGGRFDGRIIGDERRGEGRRVANVSSKPNRGRDLLVNLEEALGDALGREPAAEIEVFNDRNVELVATLLADANEGREHAFPGTLVLPPGAVEDRLRWLHTWPDLGPADAFAWLGLSGDAEWRDAVRAAYGRFADHWAASVAYHF